MRLFTISLLLLTSILTFSSDSFAQEKQYVAITKAFVNVYKDLDPTSLVVGQAKKGDHLELLATGDAWYKVKISNNEGWLEKRAGDIVNNPGNSSTGIIIAVLLFAAVAFGGVAFFIYKSKMGESA